MKISGNDYHVLSFSFHFSSFRFMFLSIAYSSLALLFRTLPLLTLFHRARRKSLYLAPECQAMAFLAPSPPTYCLPFDAMNFCIYCVMSFPSHLLFWPLSVDGMGWHQWLSMFHYEIITTSLQLYAVCFGLLYLMSNLKPRMWPIWCTYYTTNARTERERERERERETHC